MHGSIQFPNTEQALLTIVLPFKSPFKCIYALILNNVLYRILENFQGTKFLRMGHFKAFHNKFSRMTIWLSQSIIHVVKINFEATGKSELTAKIFNLKPILPNSFIVLIIIIAFSVLQNSYELKTMN